MKKLVCLALVSIFVSSANCLAGAAEAKIEEVAVYDSYSPDFDIRVKATWTGSGSKDAGVTEWLRVKHSIFGHNGVNRIHSLVTSALVSGKTVWIGFDDSTLNVTNVNLKATSN
ncbi:hypothetical protein ACJJIE_02715 [Microbulbifer sp. TRSA001]|uniref:hypothetical protein n=1 Tax=unclassified Microbulbifer TaxID=2619833 RepID=UPI0024ADE300|nr:hypothetical protein [Microbulbifer sp. VAAF005]WHI46618.1 hypothetical protein P0078_23410 [Microbulbifer sp. VAAF005]